MISSNSSIKVDNYDIESNKKSNDTFNHSTDLDDVDINYYKCCAFTCVLIFMLPLILCDLYFGFSQDDCLTKHSNRFDFKLKTYLLVSGFINSIVIVIYFVTFGSFKVNNKNSERSIILLVCGVGLSTIMGIFNMIWTILGSVLFWDYIYPNNLCNSQLSTYMFVSLIIKLIGSSSLLKSKNNDD
jgi:hypothetical protein